MSVTTDAIEAIRDKLSNVTYSMTLDISQIEILAEAVMNLTDLVEKLHARVLFLEQQQSSRDNY